MRVLTKSWKNGKDERGRYKPFTRRIRWYEGDNTSIRLHLESYEAGVAFNVYALNEEMAEEIFQRFKRGDDCLELFPGRLSK